MRLGRRHGGDRGAATCAHPADGLAQARPAGAPTLRRLLIGAALLLAAWVLLTTRASSARADETLPADGSTAAQPSSSAAPSHSSPAASSSASHSDSDTSITARTSEGTSEGTSDPPITSAPPPAEPSRASAPPGGSASHGTQQAIAEDVSPVPHPPPVLQSLDSGRASDSRQVTAQPTGIESAPPSEGHASSEGHGSSEGHRSSEGHGRHGGERHDGDHPDGEQGDHGGRHHHHDGEHSDGDQNGRGTAQPAEHSDAQQNLFGPPELVAPDTGSPNGAQTSPTDPAAPADRPATSEQPPQQGLTPGGDGSTCQIPDGTGSAVTAAGTADLPTGACAAPGIRPGGRPASAGATPPAGASAAVPPTGRTGGPAPPTTASSAATAAAADAAKHAAHPAGATPAIALGSATDIAPQPVVASGSGVRSPVAGAATSSTDSAGRPDPAPTAPHRHPVVPIDPRNDGPDPTPIPQVSSAPLPFRTGSGSAGANPSGGGPPMAAALPGGLPPLTRACAFVGFTDECGAVAGDADDPAVTPD